MHMHYLHYFYLAKNQMLTTNKYNFASSSDCPNLFSSDIVNLINTHNLEKTIIPE